MKIDRQVKYTARPNTFSIYVRTMSTRANMWKRFVFIFGRFDILKENKRDTVAGSKRQVGRRGFVEKIESVIFLIHPEQCLMEINNMSVPDTVPGSRRQERPRRACDEKRFHLLLFCFTITVSLLPLTILPSKLCVLLPIPCEIKVTV